MMNLKYIIMSHDESKMSSCLNIYLKYISSYLLHTTCTKHTCMHTHLESELLAQPTETISCYT